MLVRHFYQYVTTPTGGGTNLYTNVSSGNTVWNYDILSNPSLGFDTQLRLSYNSLSTFDTGNGFGWSIEASTPTRLGQALQFNPTWNNPTEVVGVDGTGNAHKWTWNATAGRFDSPPGVHLYLAFGAARGRFGIFSRPLSKLYVRQIDSRLRPIFEQVVADVDSGAVPMRPDEMADEKGRGNAIDRITKERVANDPYLSSRLYMAGNFEHAPGFWNTDLKTWWDMTTPGEWADHVNKYEPAFGTGIKLLTR